jgi:2-iminobutanoate/2-iminopropanoate deaminase
MKKLTLLTLCLILAAPLLTAADKKIIYPEEIKKVRPDMPFSPGVQIGTTLYVAGQTGGDIASGEYPQDFEEEVHATFKRIGMILKAAGYDFSDVVDAKVYLTDIATFPKMNSVYTQYFKSNRPARTTVGVASLVGKARIEITVVAAK